MSSLSGYVEKIVYRNSDNGYTVLTVADKSDETTCVGTFQYIGEGEYIEMEGEYMTHPSYGDQFAIKSYAIKEPEDEKAIIRYLGSGAIKGVGAALADRIVRHFNEDTFRVIEEEPERLAEVKGISKRMALEIADQLEEKKDMRKAMIFLQQYGISMNLSVKIILRTFLLQFFHQKSCRIIVSYQTIKCLSCLSGWNCNIIFSCL